MLGAWRCGGCVGGVGVRLVLGAWDSSHGLEHKSDIREFFIIEHGRKVATHHRPDEARLSHHATQPQHPPTTTTPTTTAHSTTSHVHS